jgi:hypothetical protein
MDCLASHPVHFQQRATIFQIPDEEEFLVFDAPVTEGCCRRVCSARQTFDHARMTS